MKNLHWLLMLFLVNLALAMEQDFPATKQKAEFLHEGMKDLDNTVRFAQALLEKYEGTGQYASSAQINEVITNIENLLEDPSISGAEKELLRSLRSRLFFIRAPRRLYSTLQLEPFGPEQYETEQFETTYPPMGDY